VTERDLTPLFAPRAVALVGASADPMSWGGWLAGTLAGEPGAPDLHLVNRRGGEVRGRPVHRSLADLPEQVDLAVLAIPAPAVADAVEEGLACGIRAFVVIAAGFGEESGEGLAAEQALVERVRAAGAVLVGPNCMGIYEPGSGLNATGFEAKPGPVAFAAQSGNLTIEVGRLLEEHGLGFSRLVALGNAADVGVADVLAATAGHAASRVVACYVEDARDGRALVAAVRTVAARKPVLVLAAGRSSAGAAAAASHTGALAARWRVLEAAMRDAGARLVRSPGELADAAAALVGAPALRGRRVAIMTDGGGGGAIAADLLSDGGLELVALEHATVARLRPEVPAGRVSNPVDLAGAGERDVHTFARIGETLLAAPEVDAVLLTGFFGGYVANDPGVGADEGASARRLAVAARDARKPLVVHTMHLAEPFPGIEALRAGGVPVFGRLDAAATALGHLPRPLAAPVRAAADQVEELPALPGQASYLDARALLSACGIELAEGQLAASAREAGAIAQELGGRVVLKVVARDLLHKTDAGAVELDVDPQDAAAAAAALLARVEAARPGLAGEGVFVERMAGAGLDLIVGARRDPCFGPIVLVGAGGIYAEALDDVAIALAPADPAHVAALLGGLRIAPLLAGARGQRPVDVAAVARAAVALGDLLCQVPEIVEVEANPLRAFADGVCALDARVVSGAALTGLDTKAETCMIGDHR
jgi:acyl-CoA synthetase (NDP forming)